ncbi:MAG: NAD(P)-dependent glycerol-3-phosphate dehydrogenase [Rhodospirillaceae bacterium]|nr:NAD(P)-dependent glycerol-3-phosphate dehydrogenase [Rhodospirillaceae bacterium]MYF85361.1 NAD(P)-dependent glycerol-3-phosphate dehydrogenase [Rhodospirillaceae bacterium]MYH36762.1 NAD(P)-dependent glycerol-3-phosphate dehydrogenase [Rhodospirillaceae bacterium]MYK14559.1 NAD(P)-dependent glycerol-3-phosphate dehydrogenase [Rhodospirillaceae bacterium]
MSRIAIIGAGAWGTALAITAARAGCTVGLWAREPEVVESIRRDRRNAPFLPDHAVDAAVLPTGDLEEAVAGAELALLAPPAQHVGAVAARLAVLPECPPFVVCAKGIERAAGRLMTEVLAGALPGHPAAVLSGPTFAGEVAAGLPAAVTVASADRQLAEAIAGLLGTPRFRIYLSDDPVGVEIGGAVKNVIAIACGIVVGAGLGENARAAVVTRGLAETVRLAVARGGRAQTLAGLSGIGDMMLTCNSFQSRNMSLGAALGAEPGRIWTPDDVLAARDSLAEGFWTAAAVIEMAQKLNVEMPICAGVNAVLHRGEIVQAMVDSLMARRFREE